MRLERAYQPSGSCLCPLWLAAVLEGCSYRSGPTSLDSRFSRLNRRTAMAEAVCELPAGFSGTRFAQVMPARPDDLLVVATNDQSPSAPLLGDRRPTGGSNLAQPSGPSGRTGVRHAGHSRPRRRSARGCRHPVCGGRSTSSRPTCVTPRSSTQRRSRSSPPADPLTWGACCPGWRTVAPVGRQRPPPPRSSACTR